MSFVKKAWDGITGKTAAKEASKAAEKAAETQAGWEQDALDFQREQFDWLKGIYEPRQDMSMDALERLQGIYGSDDFGITGVGDVEFQDVDVGALNQDPLYQAQLAQINQAMDTAENRAARTAAATGGLRGGGVQGSFRDLAAQQSVMEQQALADAYQNQYARNVNEYNRAYGREVDDYGRALGMFDRQLSGLAGLGGIDTGIGAIQQAGQGIAGSMSGIGQTLGQGQIGAASSANAARQAGIGNLLGLGGLGVGIAGLFSDDRLKEDIVKIGEKSGFNWYSWKWNERANDIGLEGEAEGFLASEIEEAYPELIIEDETGYKQVNYEVLNG